MGKNGRKPEETPHEGVEDTNWAFDDTKSSPKPPALEHEVDVFGLEAQEQEGPCVATNLEAGERVRIKSGPFKGKEGTVDKVFRSKGLVRVITTVLRRATPVDLEYTQVDKGTNQDPR